MRPRQSSLGILSGVLFVSLLAMRCFNEAEAIKPRNLQLDRRSASQPGGFNEAEAIKPRNPEDRHRIAERMAASMRPRQSSLGIRLLRWILRLRSASLQ